MIADCNPYVIEQKIGNDFLRDTAFSHKKEKQIIIKQFSFIEEANYIKPNKVSPKYLVYNFKNIFSLKIPVELQFLLNAYIKSEYIILLEEDWDDNGSSKYNIETWQKSLTFVNEYSATLLNDFNKKIEIPKIYHGPKGSIDILFENKNYSLLINILDNDTNRAVYYGRDLDGNISKGEININKINNALIPIAFNL